MTIKLVVFYFGGNTPLTSSPKVSVWCKVWGETVGKPLSMQMVPRCRLLREKMHWRRFRNESKDARCSFKCRCSIGSIYENEDLWTCIINVLFDFLLLLLCCQHLWVVKVTTERWKVMLSYYDTRSHKDRQLNVSPRDTITSINIYLFIDDFFFLQRTRSTSLVYQREFHFLIDFKQWRPWNIQSIHISEKNKGSIWKED